MLRYILLLLVCITTIGIDSSAQVKDYFTVLESTPPKDYYRIAHKIYDTEIMLLDSVKGTQALKQLDVWADKKGDKELKALYLVLLADYYRELYRPALTLENIKKAIPLATEQKAKNLLAEAYNTLGLLYYHQYQNYPLAFENMLRTNNIIQNEIGFSNYVYSSKFLYDLGFMYFDFGNIAKAHDFILSALKYPSINNTYAIRLYNTLALIYRKKGQVDSASHYFKEGLVLAEKIDYKAWIGILNGNLGAIYHSQKRFSEALPLLQIDYRISKERKQWVSAANAVIMMAAINIETRTNLQQAEMQLAEAYTFYKTQKDLSILLYYSLQKAQLCKLKNDLNGAYAYLDSAKSIQENITKRKDAIVFSQAEQKVAFEQHLSDIKLLESENSKKILLRNSIIMFAILLLIIAGQFIYKQQLKRRKDQEILGNAKKQLNYYIDSVKEKNLLIEQFEQEIEHLNSIPYNNELQAEKTEMTLKLKRYTILTEDDWSEFKYLFEKVHIGFFDALRGKCPSLTQAEIRLLSLIKLNLTKKEMANMLGISPESINRTSQRIRKKINLQDHLQLEELVASL